MAPDVPLRDRAVEMKVSPVVVAGGGLAGAAAAAALARAGLEVTVLEREAGPRHKICGEFLSVEAQDYLVRLGLDLAPLGGHVISHLRLIGGARSVVAPLPFQALGLSRLALDEALLNHAAACGAVLRRGETVRRINAEGATVETSRGEVLHARTTLLATGKHDLHGRRRAWPASDFVGFKMHFQLAPEQTLALSGFIELAMLRCGYAGLQLVEQQQANLCLLVRRSWLLEAGGDWAGVLERLLQECRHLGTRLAGASALFTSPLSIACVPYGFLHRPTSNEPSLFRLGDQAAVIPSFTGDGMAIALHTAALATHHVLRGQSAAAYHARLRHNVRGQLRRAAGLQALAGTPWSQLALLGLGRVSPAALTLAARLTRVPASAKLSSSHHKMSRMSTTSSAKPSPPP